MATKKSITSNIINNKGGAVLNGGTASEVRPVLGARPKSVNANVGVFGSTVVDGVNTEPALDGGDFAKLHAIVARRVSRSLAGVDNTVLLSGAAVPGLVRGIHKLEVLRTQKYSTAFRAGQFNLYTGQYSPAPTVSTDTLATDNAANPTRSVPGQLVFKLGGPIPVTSNYKSKTN